MRRARLWACHLAGALSARLATSLVEPVLKACKTLDAAVVPAAGAAAAAALACTEIDNEGQRPSRKVAWNGR